MLQQAQTQQESRVPIDTAAFKALLVDWKHSVLQASSGVDQLAVCSMIELADTGVALLQRLTVVQAALTIREHIDSAQKVQLRRGNCGDEGLGR